MIVLADRRAGALVARQTRRSLDFAVARPTHLASGVALDVHVWPRAALWICRTRPTPTTTLRPACDQGVYTTPIPPGDGEHHRPGGQLQSGSLRSLAP